MVDRVWEQVSKYQMIEQGDKVIAGISGGADSVCLLFMLLELQKKVSFSIQAVHVEHGVRGNASEEDARFVRKLCEEHHIPFLCRHVNVPALAAERKVSVEEAGRMARYEIFEEMADRLGGAKIAVAHNQNDNAETVLLNLFRGTGLRGLCGIPPVRGRIIRPLLQISRREIEEYLAETGQDYCHDATNDCGDYTRNRIRLHILPLAEEEINPKAAAHAADSAELLRETEEFLLEEAEELAACCVVTDGKAEERFTRGRDFDEKSEEISILLPKFAGASRIIKRYVIRMCLEKLGGGLKDISRVHIDSVLALAEGETGRQTALPGDIAAVKSYDRLIFRKGGSEKKAEEKRNNMEEAVLFEPETGRIKEVRVQDYYFLEEVLERKENEKIPEKTYTKWFDYDIIKNTVQIRTRRPGDYLIVDQQGGRQKLKTYFINEKIPREERERQLLLADGSHVLWVIGRRISEGAKVTGQTKKVLKVQAEKIVPYGGNHAGEN